VHVTFSKPINPLTVTSSTIAVSGGLPALTVVFDSSNQGVTLTTVTPLPGNTSVGVAVSGVQDVAGNNITPFSASFSTAAGPDFTVPTVVSTSVDNVLISVPVNAVFTVVFSKPMDMQTVSFVPGAPGQTVTGTLSSSADATIATFAPSAALAPATAYSLNS